MSLIDLVAVLIAVAAMFSLPVIAFATAVES